jgi:inorganic pyrophosphatase
MRIVLVLVLALTSVGCAFEDLTPGRDRNYHTDFPASPEPGLINVVVEIPSGTNAKWEVTASGTLEWEIQDSTPRVVQYLPYPANYGMIPRTLLPESIGADGDPLDVVLLGPALERGSVVMARPIGILLLRDDGERDDKILAVLLSGPLSDVLNLADLEGRFPGSPSIIETWFTNYKGPGRLESPGFAGADMALETVEEASRYFEDHASEVRGRD